MIRCQDGWDDTADDENVRALGHRVLRNTTERGDPFPCHLPRHGQQRPREYNHASVDISIRVRLVVRVRRKLAAPRRGHSAGGTENDGAAEYGRAGGFTASRFPASFSLYLLAYRALIAAIRVRNPAYIPRRTRHPTEMPSLCPVLTRVAVVTQTAAGRLARDSQPL